MSRSVVSVFVLALAGSLLASDAEAQRIDENCTALIMNRVVQVSPNGTFAIPDVPVDQGQYRVRVVCRRPDGTTETFVSTFQELVANGANEVPNLMLADGQPIPLELQVVAFRNTMFTRGETQQVEVRGVMPDGSTRELTQSRTGTTYATSNPLIATVSPDGLVTALRRGQVVISARNEGVLGSAFLFVDVPEDADGDGIPDAYERVHGLNLNDPTDAALDLDGDGVSNQGEYQQGTNPRAADTDGDGVSDGQELTRGTNPVTSDSDSDGLSDGDEVRRGTNPLSADSDGDGLSDGVEIQLGLNPIVSDTTTTVQGRVLSGVPGDNNAPVAGATVLVFGVLSAQTTASGTFSIPNVPSTLGPIAALGRIIRNNQVLEGVSESHAPVSGAVTDVDTIVLGVNSGTVNGLVTDPNNQPVPGAQVTVTSGGDRRTTTTDVTGRYRVANLQGGAVVVTVIDTRTGLRGMANGTLPQNGSANVDVRLGAAGTVRGTVLNRDLQPVGAGVLVRLTGGTVREMTTDARGQYLFDFLPLASFTVEATDAQQNRGRTVTSLTLTGQVAVADVTFLGRGSVTGVVRTGAGVGVPNAPVTLASQSIFGGNRSTTTDSEGRFSFGDVFLGVVNVSARSTVSSTAGQATGELTQDGGTLELDIDLTATGTIAGQVFRAGPGSTPAAGVRVDLSNGRTMVTNTEGAYQFDLVPVGNYTIDVTDTATGDRGRGTANIPSQGQTGTANITLNGQAPVTVEVRDGTNALVSGAQVTISGTGTFGGSFQGATAADGSVTFPRVFVGPFNVNARNPLTQLSGTGNGTATLGSTTTTLVRLQAAGAIFGLVLPAGSETPVSNVAVQLSGPVSRRINNPANGQFRFDNVPVGTYALSAVDAGGFVIGTASGIAVGTQGEEVQRNIRLIGMGSITGVVTSPGGAPAQGVPISVTAHATGFSRTFQAITDVNGVYTVADRVPIGAATVVASQRVGAQQLFGAAGGTLNAPGETLTINIELSANLVPTTTTLYDANNFEYNLRENGSLQDGTRQFFGGDFGANRGGMLLDIIANGQVNRFNGEGFGSSELNGRQIGIRQQQGLAGLTVTRKVFVPLDGYFARYLEVLENPGTSAVTVDVRVTSHSRFISKVQNGFTFNREPRIVATSGGNVVLSPNELWAVLDDDEDLDPFTGNNLPAVAHVFQGDAAGLQPERAEFALVGSSYGQLVNEWRNVTVPPGGRVVFMHFVSQETSRSAAAFAADRLASLPPEVLVGLTMDDAAATLNFAVPSDLASALPPLPSLQGAVAGIVQTFDLTPVPGATVLFRGTHPLFGRTYSVNANSQGEFRLNARLANGSSIPVPVIPDDDNGVAFELRARHPQTNLLSPPAVGAFVDGLVVATRDVTFTNSGVLTGIVRRANGALVTSGTVQVSGGGLGIDGLVGNLSTPIGAGGVYLFSLLPGGAGYLITASLPHPQGTALSTVATADVVESQTRTADLVIPPTGSVTGVVRHADSSLAVNLAVQLIGQGLTRSTRTDTGGRFTFTDVYEGAVRLETSHQGSNTAAIAIVNIVGNTDQTQNLNLRVGGVVTGLVSLNGAPSVGAQVTIEYGEAVEIVSTDASGRYRLENVTPGLVRVSAVSPENIRGYNAGTLGLSGQTLTLDIGLYQGGVVSGQVFRAGTTTPVPGVQVSINRFVPGLPSQVTTNNEGRFTFQGISIGTFVLDATDPATGDRGRATNQINANNETRTINITLTGQGEVIVTVRDASQNLISNANVTVISQSTFGGSQQATTGPDGTARFERVLAGQFTASAFDPGTGLGGSAVGTATVGGTTSLAVELEAAGTLTGRVFVTNGNPATSGVVRLFSQYGFLRQVNIDPDGRYQFNAVPLGTYNIDTLDGANRIRARRNGLVLASNGETVTADLTFVGLGAVTGIVRNPNGTAAPSVSVQVRSGNTEVGGFFTTSTDSDGSYRVSGVPIGTFVATASNPSAQLLGETSGQISQDAQEIVADIQLLSNGITLPRDRYDANDFWYRFQANGVVRDGTNSVFGGDFSSNYGSFFLDVIRDGTSNTFAGGTTGTQEDGGREIAVRQNDLAGLNITRKMFVPNTGYFVRYLEQLTNPTNDPITVDVRILNNLWGWQGSQRVVSSSSGDTLLDASNAETADRWVVLDDGADNDPFQNYGPPSTAFVFDGDGGALRASTAAFRATSFGQVEYRWNSVTVPAGGRVILMHVGLQQVSRAAAQASAARLGQLPPELLSGLSPDEIADIRNFPVPADGSSALTPIALNGQVGGQVYEGDGTTPVGQFSQVRIRSNNLLYGRTRFVNTDANGVYGLNSTFPTNPDSSGALPVPVEPFTVFARHPQTSVLSPSFTGLFTAPQTFATRDIVFTNTGRLTGLVTTSAGVPVTSGQVQASGGSPFQNVFVNLNASGRYSFGGLSPGNFTLTASAFHPQGSALTAARAATVITGQSVTADIAMPPTGAVSGVVRDGGGTPTAGVFVRLRTSTFAFSRSMNTAAGGAFQFPDVAAGSYILEAFEPSTGVTSSATVVVVAGQTQVSDLALIALGTLQLQVNFASGAPAPSSYVEVAETARGGGFRGLGYTDAAGRLTVTSVAVGNLTVRARHPQTFNLFTEVASAIASHGQTVNLTVALPGTGVLTGRVLRPRGTTVTNAYIEVYEQATNIFYGWAQTDSNGDYTITQLPVGRALRITGYDPNNSNYQRRLTGETIAADGDTRTLDLTLPALATLRVTVRRSDGEPLTGARIEVRDPFRNYFRYGGDDDDDGTADGVVMVSEVGEGNFSVLAYTSTGSNAGTASGTIAPSDDGGIVEVTVNAPLSGDIEGTVYAGDGETPIPWHWVEFYDAATDNYLGQASTNENGYYRRNGLVASEVRVRTYSPNDYSVTVDETVTFEQTGQVVTQDLLLPVSVLRGTIYYSDGTPAEYPDVFARSLVNGDTYYAQNSEFDGTYLILGVPVGEFELTAQDDEIGLTGQVSGQIVDVATAVTLDVTLPPTGSVSGHVYGPTGIPIPNTWVALISSAAAWDQWTSTDSTGSYSFDRVAVGSVLLQTCDYSTGWEVCGSAAGTLTQANQSLIVDIVLPGTGSLFGTVVNSAGQPVASSQVNVETVVNGGPNGTPNRTVYTDVDGRYEVANFPMGRVRVNARDPNNGANVAVATGEVGQATGIDLTLGSAYSLGTYNLDGADGFRYDVRCYGELSDGGNVSRTQSDAYDSAYYLVDGQGEWNLYFECMQAGLLEQEGREVVLGPAAFAGPVSATRKVFVPEEGGFARYLDTLENSGDTDVSLSIRIELDLGSDGSTRIVVPPSLTSNRFAVTDQSGFCCDPALAHVFAGPDGTIGVSATHFFAGEDDAFYNYQVTIPANSAITLMHFAVQRQTSDTAGAEAQATALVNLTDGKALRGMTDQDKQRVVNFRIPTP